MTENIIPLYPESTPAAAAGDAPAKTRLYPGRSYRFDFPDKEADPPPGGMVGNYRFDSHQARLDAVTHDGGAYVYETDAALSGDWAYHGEPGRACRFAGNRLTLDSTEMNGPELSDEEALTTLSLQPMFRLSYHTDAYAAQLGVIHLVQSQRFVTLADGERLELLEAEQPVLYLVAEQAIETLGPAQPPGRHQDYRYRIDVRQAIPSRLNDVAVESVTVLEQYRSYFMQREAGQDEGQVIWIPALAPVTWGWSIRVGRRADQHWGILRRKLILPTVGHDGLEFPLWEDNHLSLSRPLPAGH